MQQENTISGQNINEIRQQLTTLFDQDPDMLSFNAAIVLNDTKVLIDIDIDLGGGFESGYETTTFLAPLHSKPPFRFAIHKEHFTDEIGKFLGMEDIELGYPEFDKKLVIKTNEPAKIHDVFSEPAARGVFQNLTDFTFGITTHHEKDSHNKLPYLELMMEEAVTDANRLVEIYEAFYTVLIKLDKSF